MDQDEQAMTSVRRVVPEWRYFLPRLQETIKELRASGDDENEVEEDTTAYVDASPTLQQRYSCLPNHLQCLTTTHPGCPDTVAVGFRWGHRMTSHRMEVWVKDRWGQLCHNLSLPLERGYKVQRLVFIPSQRVCVGACNDLSLRVFSDPTRKMSVLYQAACRASVLCMHYCKETGELLTGSMGIITFWGFWTSPEAHLGILRVLDWRCSSLLRETIIHDLVTDRKTSTLLVLCDGGIKSFEHTGQREYRAFRGQAHGTLLCVSADWVQRRLFTGDTQGCVQVWSSDTRSLLQEFKAHSDLVSTVLVRPSTHTLFTSSPDGWVKEWIYNGHLFLQFHLGDSGGVKNLFLFDEHAILCHCPSSFSIWKLQSLYRMFSDPGCGMQLLRRVEVGRGNGWILTVSQDSIVKMISPTSGEMLLLSWPFFLLDFALSFAYNPDQKELLVASGRTEVLVLDMTLSPSPAKRIIQIAENFDEDESVMCLEAVMLGMAECTRAKYLSCLVFSGHCNGKIQLLSPQWLHCPPRYAHSGAILQMSSQPGPGPQLCCYGSDKHLSVWRVEVGKTNLEIVPLARISCSSSLVLTRLLCGLVFATCDKYNLHFFSLPSGNCLSIDRKPPTSISCIDYCAALDLVAFSGPMGTVEVWEKRGVQLAEIFLGTPVCQVCFANARGDLLASFRGSIYIISSLSYMPVRMLTKVLQLNSVDDILEDPLPFLPYSESFYDINVVPKLLFKPGHGTPEPREDPVVERTDVKQDLGNTNSEKVINKWMKKTEPPSAQGGQPGLGSHAMLLFENVEKVKTEMKEDIVEEEEVSLEPEPTERVEDQDKSQTTVETFHVKTQLLKWPLAPDGFIPNSVIRSWRRAKETPKMSYESMMLTPKSFRVFKHEPKAPSPPGEYHPPQKEEEEDMEEEKEEEEEEEKEEEEEEQEENPFLSMLKHIANSQWLVKKPSHNLSDVMAKVLLTMDGLKHDVYRKCTDTLLCLVKNFDIPQSRIQKNVLCFLQHTAMGNPHWKRVGGIKNLQMFLPWVDQGKENYLHELAPLLLDKSAELRNITKEILVQSYNIQTKSNLLIHLETYDEKMNDEAGRPASCDENKLLHQLDTKLSEDMELKASTSKVKKLPESYKQRKSSSIPKDPPVEFQMETPNTLTPEQEPRFSPYLPPIKPQSLPPQAQRPHPPAQEYPQPHLKFKPSDHMLKKDQRFSIAQCSAAFGAAPVHQSMQSTQHTQLAHAGHHSHPFHSDHPAHLGQPTHPTQTTHPGQSISCIGQSIQLVKPAYHSHPFHSDHPAHLGQPTHPTQTTHPGQSTSCSGQTTQLVQPPHPSQPPPPTQFPHYKPVQVTLNDSGVTSLSSLVEQQSISRTEHCWPKNIRLEQVKGQQDAERIPDWRENLHKLISLYGFRSPRAARLAARERLMNSHDVEHLLPTIPALQLSQVASNQRVVQKIQMKDTLEKASFQFHHELPLDFQLSSFTLEPSGKIQYGKLQVYWSRGSVEAKMLKLPSIKINVNKLQSTP